MTDDELEEADMTEEEFDSVWAKAQEVEVVGSPTFSTSTVETAHWQWTPEHGLKRLP